MFDVEDSLRVEHVKSAAACILMRRKLFFLLKVAAVVSETIAHVLIRGFFLDLGTITVDKTNIKAKE